MTTTIMTATMANAVNALLEHQKASPIVNVNDITDMTVITVIKFINRDGDIVKCFFMFGEPSTDEIESTCDFFLGNILKKGGGSKKYENGSTIFVQFKTIKDIKEEDEFRIGMLSRYSEKQIIRYFKKIMK